MVFPKNSLPLMILYKQTKEIVCSLGGDTVFFGFVDGVV